ncbi:hypothetical protein VTK56DRAFT_7319 [Thermocarpiscus australiensis]
MPRQLPWKVKGAATTHTPSRPKATASPAASASRSPAPSHRSAALSTTTPKAESTAEPSRKQRRSLGLGAVRSPSTSPPPEPLKEEFMIEGFDHDDKYRMVEDEFRAVAGEFTKHLHAAEYQRLKNLAKSQNAETIQNISRPATGEMTDLVKRRHAALDTAAKQRKGIEKALGKRAARSGLESEDEESKTRRPLTSLQGLMDSPRKNAVPLTSAASVTRDSIVDTSPSRRPRRPSSPETQMEARGRSTMNVPQGSTSIKAIKREPTPDFDDDDLDSQPPWPSKYRDVPRLGRIEGSPVRRSVATEQKFGSTAPSNSASTASKEPRRTMAHDTSTSEQLDAADDNDDDFFSRLRARRAEQKRRRESKYQSDGVKTSDSQAEALNEIPFI